MQRNYKKNLEKLKKKMMKMTLRELKDTDVKVK